VARKFGFVCLRFDPLRWYIQLNSLTAIDMFCWLSDLEVTLQIAVQVVSGSILCSGKDILLAFLFCCCFGVFIFCPKNIFYMKFCKSFCNISSFRILNILQHLWPFLRAYRYKPSIIINAISQHKKNAQRIALINMWYIHPSDYVDHTNVIILYLCLFFSFKYYSAIYRV